ncbi:MAG TPA: serine/threonine-protein kinase [Pirellulales bacterium]|nr:serine/threonine-protein kinase [Pirellulales bacterium]
MDRSSCLDDAQLLALIEQPQGEPAAALHLDGCADCQDRLARVREDLALLRDTGPVRRNPTADVTTVPVAEAKHGLPNAIGPYLVLEWLGRGGEADVFRAEHPVLRHNVALKWSRRPFQGTAEPLVEEGRTLAALDVEGVARVFDLGLHEGRPYLVMQMLRGRTLHHYAAEAPLSHREMARLIARVARILARAHAQQVWHRDLKPSNIVIDGEGNPTIIDFGMAGFSQPWRDDAPCSGGTLHFMAPEQAKQLLGLCDERTGAVPVVGPRSDIFALGAVLYSLLTEHAPFPRSEDSAALIDRVCRGDFDRRRLAARGLPRRLVTICLRAMAYDPADRYASADAMAHDLERFARSTRRNSWLATAGALVLVTAGIALMLMRHGEDLSNASPKDTAVESVPPSPGTEAVEISAVQPPDAERTEPPTEAAPETGSEMLTGDDESEHTRRSRHLFKGRGNDSSAKSEAKPKPRRWIPHWLREWGK